ncbi:hypothetical protein BH10BAC3_BH10BAC3_22550 [soil metagenome]
MRLIPIRQEETENTVLINNALCRDTVFMTMDFYKRAGYKEPWIGYIIHNGEEFVGAGGFKGVPINGCVEIAYGTFENYTQKGVGTTICNLLVRLATEADSSLIITARTMPGSIASEKILLKNAFHLMGIVDDPEDGNVNEWIYNKVDD